VTRSELEQLRPGDSIIGFARKWDDEFPVVSVDRVHYDRDGRPSRNISVRCGGSVLTGEVRAFGNEIRGEQGRSLKWSTH